MGLKCSGNDKNIIRDGDWVDGGCGGDGDKRSPTVKLQRLSRRWWFAMVEKMKGGRSFADLTSSTAVVVVVSYDDGGGGWTKSRSGFGVRRTFATIICVCVAPRRNLTVD